MSIKKHIPNAITCCNLLCGCLAIVQAFEGNLVYSAYLVGLAAIFDFFDGFAARLLKVASPIGKDLDSLADMVTFGVVPGIVMYKLLAESFIRQDLMQSENVSGIIRMPYEVYQDKYFYFLPFIIVIFSAIRLAKFNHDTRQTSSFIGLPTPANAIFICSLPLVMNAIGPGLFHPYTLIGISIVLSLLLVAEIPLFALKFRNFSWTGNRIRYTFLGLSLFMLAVFKVIGIPLIIILYVLISIITNIYLKRKTA